MDKQIEQMIQDALAKQRPRSNWLTVDGVNVYLRVGNRYVEGGQLTFCITVANVTVRKRGKGTFTRFLETLEASKYPVYVENVLNERLRGFLTRRGYKGIPFIDRCYIKGI